MDDLQGARKANNIRMEKEELLWKKNLVCYGCYRAIKKHAFSTQRLPTINEKILYGRSEMKPESRRRMKRETNLSLTSSLTFSLNIVIAIY